MIADAHCHFFSSRFLELLSQPIPDLPAEGRAVAVASKLGWSDSGNPAALAATWIAELDRHSVSRAALSRRAFRATKLPLPKRSACIQSVSSASSCSIPRRRERTKNSSAPSPSSVCAASACSPRCTATAPRPCGRRLFASPRAPGGRLRALRHAAIGVRGKLGLPSPFDLRLGDPLALAAVAAGHPTVPVIVPHFGPDASRRR